MRTNYNFLRRDRDHNTLFADDGLFREFRIVPHCSSSFLNSSLSAVHHRTNLSVDLKLNLLYFKTFFLWFSDYHSKDNWIIVLTVVISNYKFLYFIKKNDQIELAKNAPSSSPEREQTSVYFYINYTITWKPNFSLKKHANRGKKGLSTRCT